MITVLSKLQNISGRHPKGEYEITDVNKYYLEKN